MSAIATVTSEKLTEKLQLCRQATKQALVVETQCHGLEISDPDIIGQAIRCMMHAAHFIVQLPRPSDS